MTTHFAKPCLAPAAPRPPGATRRTLLHSVSLTALMVSAGTAMAPAGHAASFRTIGQSVAAGAGAAAAASANAAATQGARQAALGALNVATAAARFRTLSQALAGMAYTGPAIPDGAQAGGLQQAPGVAGSASSTLWSGASTTLTLTGANGVSDVTVTQTAPVASLQWQSFNVGAKTKLIFNQSVNGVAEPGWVAINTVNDPSANPSTILGQISAPGKVFVLNPNGILFGAGSQLNVGSLVASTASIAQAQLTTDTNGLINGFSLYGTASAAGTITPTFTGATASGSITVDAGAAIITASPTGTEAGGYVMLLADTVQNGGFIATPKGQTILAAGTDFAIQPGSSVSNPTATVIGSDIAVSNKLKGAALGTLGTATNAGIIMADQGDVTMVGHQVVQDGDIVATTTVDTRGTVHLLTDASDATASVVLGAGSVTEIVPLAGTQTALNSQRQANLAASIVDNAARLTPTGIVLNDYNTLADTLGESRIEISTGGAVVMQGGALALAQGGQVAVAAGRSIAVDTGATIDVSGADATLPAIANSLTITDIVPYTTRDSAGNRASGVQAQNVTIDVRALVEIASGAYAGNIYTAGGLLEVSGNLGLVPHGINEWSSIAGQVTLQSASKVGSALVGGTISVAAGATINLTGGTVTYDTGLVPQSYLQAADGRIFNVNDAPGNLVYTGVYTGVVEAHPRWHITDTFSNPLLTPAAINEPAYVIGRDAGTLTVSAAAGAIDGTIAAGVTTGAAQIGARATGITDPFLLAQAVAPLAGSLNAGLYEGGSQYGTIAGTLFQSNVLISGPGTAPQGVIRPLPDSVAGTISIDAAALSADGLATVAVYTAGGIALSGPVAVANGGTLTLGAPIIDVSGSVTAHGGTIVLTNLLPSTTGFTGISSTPGAITVAGGVTLDATGTWTNLQRDAADTSQEAYAAGGRILVTGTGPVDLAAGAVLNVSSGGILSAAGKLTAEAGGSIAVSADLVPLNNATIDQGGAVTYAAQFVGLASGSAGTLALTAPEFVLGPQQTVLFNTVLVGQSLFDGGFGSYALNGYLGLYVDAGEQLAVTRPVYSFSNGAVPTGAAAADAFTVTLPQLYTQARGGDSFTQRAGASLTLQSSVDPTVYNGNGATVQIGAAAIIAVDPRQSITVEGYGQVTVLGTLVAHGGAITVANTRYEQIATGGSHDIAANYQDGLSVWIGGSAVLDTSGQATILTDALGRSFGQAQAGGTIQLGGLGGANAASQESTYAQVILRPGAVLNAAGASATVDVVPSTEPASISPVVQPTILAGNGGTIIARSYDGVALDGTMLAAGSGPGAAGGTLIMRLDPESLDTYYGYPAAYFTPSQIVIGQAAMPLQLPTGIEPGQPTAADTFRLASISQQQISTGGFDSLTLYAQDEITFTGSVDLTLGRSLVLSTAIIGDTQPRGAVAVTVPYLSLFGYSSNANGGFDVDGPAKLSPDTSTASLTLNSTFIDITNNLALGGHRLVSSASTVSQPASADAYGFADAVFNSAGDIRFNQDSAPASEITALSSSGNILFDAQQLYPATAATAAVTAGEHPAAQAGVNQLAGGTLTVEQQAGSAPDAPFSVGGTLTLIADQVVQDGVVRAPEGVINLGIARNNGTLAQLTDAVTLGAGSTTSVSLAGLSIPYGGTVDGVNYLYAGAPALTFTPMIQIAASSATVQPGAILDISGGGSLTGAGFIPGRGGSADVNKTPLLTSGTGTIAAGAADPVFAILSGYGSLYAPIAPGDAGYSTPTQGEQIAVQAGEVAGLSAGTYTLVPAYYDLLPGAYRVELTGAPMTAGTTTSFGNETTIAAVTLATANTGVFGSTPTAALITAGAGVRQLSQYNEENYSTFEINKAATFNAPRPLLPEDAKTLAILINTPATPIPANDQPISIESGSLLQSAPAGGYGATLEIAATAPIEILGAGESVVPYSYIDSVHGTVAFGDYGVTSAMLDALAIPRLVIGGTLTASRTNANLVDLQGLTPDVLVLPKADLTAGDIMLTTVDTGLIRVEGGAVISTLGQPATAYGLAQGIYFNSDNTNANSGANPVLALSNNPIAFTPNGFTGQGAAIEVDTGATLEALALVKGALTAVGSLNFVAPLGTSVNIGEANLRAATVDVQVADINIGSAQALASFAPILPQGLTLGSDTLNVLAQGATTLTLTANQAVNIIGSVDLNSGNTDLVLNTPAIYGYGITSGGAVSDPGAVTIQAPSFTWSGIAALASLQTGTTAVSSAPGGQLAGTVVNGQSTLSLAGAAGLTIDAATIDLGYGPAVQIDDQVKLDRLAVGFGTVTLTATSELTANNQSSLSVFATQPAYGQPGAAGNLVLTTPLLTAASGAVLDLTAGGSLSVTNGGQAARATGTISTLGATIDLVASAVSIDTAVALPSGKLSIAAAGDGSAPTTSIDLQPGSVIDLSGRAVPLFDQTAYSTGGTLLMAAAAGGINQEQGGLIDISSPGANAGVIQAVALAGAVDFTGTLSGSAPVGHQAGSFTIAAAALPDFDALNATLDAGAITGARNFEAATGDIKVDQTVTGHTVTIAADAGNIDVTGLINASGATPGSIALSAGGTLTLESGAVLDAHATKARVDSTGQEINAENRAHVTLTSAGGEIVLAQGATINVAYPDATNNPQGEIVLNAPRAGGNGVAVTAAASLTITGAYSIALNAFTTYSPADPLGTIVQDNGTGDTLGSGYGAVSAAGTLGVVQIGLDNQLYMNAVDANGAALASQLAGLDAYGARFHLRPGVLIESTAATGNNLTISGDIDFSQLRYNDPSQFGTVTNGKPGSGEPGSVVFRAANNLTVNGSVSDGFALPPDETNGTPLPADVNGWKYLALANAGEVTNADLLLPAGAVAVTGKSGTSTQIVLIGTTDIVDLFSTTYDTYRPISLNYPIVINPARLNANVVIPFALTVGQASAPVPAGGWVATAPITRGGVTLFAKGQVIPAGFVFRPDDILGTGTILPVQVVTGVDAASGTGQTVPPGTLFTIFYDSTISLAQNTAVLPANAFIPGTTAAIFGAVTADGSVAAVKTLDLRPTQDIAGNMVQGYLTPLAPMLTPGTQSWSLDFVAGANLAGANVQAVLPGSTLNGSVFATTPSMTNQAPGSILLDDQHYYADAGGVPSLAFSVIRTGTGDLSMVAGGDIDQSSLYGIYTAGTQAPLGRGNNPPFEDGRYDQGGDYLLPGKSNQAASLLIQNSYQAYYPNNGGDVLFAAQGDVTGDVYASVNNGATGTGTPASDAIGNWLWRQGSTQLGQPTAWWINFGTLAAPLNDGALAGDPVQMVGFQGIGALGGGNVTVNIGGDAGQMTNRDEANAGPAAAGNQRGEGLIIAVGSTGRILAGTTIPKTTGGGDVSVTIGGTLNRIDAGAYGVGATAGSQSGESPAVNGDIIDVRGNVSVTAGAIGRIDPVYSATATVLGDPRTLNPFASENGIPNGGIEVAPGDGTVDISTLRDLVLAGAADPGRVTQQNLTDLSAYHRALRHADNTGGNSGFTLWQPGTSISLFSDGGGVTPTMEPNQTLASLIYANDRPTDYRSVYPPSLLVTAATGNIVYGQYGVTPSLLNARDLIGKDGDPVVFSLETMPAANGQVSFLAGQSIFANFYAIDISGADPAGLSRPLDPAFTSAQNSANAVTNVLTGLGTRPSTSALFALEADTPTTNLHADDPTPARFYAAGGDVLDFQTGETLSFVTPSTGQVAATWYIAAKPVWILASQDIVSTGTQPAADPGDALFASQENQSEVIVLGAANEFSSGNLFLNNSPQAISVMSAGRDILGAYTYVGGPGLLEVQAGRNLYQASAVNAAGTGQLLSFGSIKSLGNSLIAGGPVDLSGGAGISVLAGVGAAGPDYTAFAKLYFNPANQADLSIPLSSAANKGKVQAVYATQLQAWLAANYGYTGTAADALQAFLALPAIDQNVFVRQIFFAELQATGTQEANPASPFYKSYARGRLAIDTLLPSTGTELTPGVPVGYSGAVTMYSGPVLNNGGFNSQPLTTQSGATATFDGGIATLFGGSVQVLAPGGQSTFGVPGGPAPGNNSGVVTYGSGDIDIYSLGNVLLGKSRIFTTAGGNILIWSSAGDINAGIGAKTTQVFDPPVLVYDAVGDITATPPSVSTGAGIATLQPLPEVPAGDVTLIAPLGTIDAGEAGIRVSGNLTLAAAQIANSAGISVKGSTAGAPTVSVASLGAVEAAGAAAGAAASTAQSQAQRSGDDRQAASVLDVEVISIGGTYDEEKKRRRL